MSATKASPLRLRVFAGPNGSGKTTLANFIKRITIGDKKIDFGIYVNADDIAADLEKGGVSFRKFEIITTPKEFRKVAMNSGLINEHFDEQTFLSSFKFRANRLTLTSAHHKELLAQVAADFLRKQLLAEKKKFSFETVFSHPSKLDIMRDAVKAGYKVYLYFVSTEDPGINVFRVEARKEQGGHNVPEIKIRSRYEKSMDQLFEASLIADQSYFFDNSSDASEPKLIAEARKNGLWQFLKVEQTLPNWFRKYFILKHVEHVAHLDS